MSSVKLSQCFAQVLVLLPCWQVVVQPANPVESPIPQGDSRGWVIEWFFLPLTSCIYSSSWHHPGTHVRLSFDWCILFFVEIPILRQLCNQWTNPSGKWFVGVKLLAQLFPDKVKNNVQVSPLWTCDVVPVRCRTLQLFLITPPNQPSHMHSIFKIGCDLLVPMFSHLAASLLF